MRRCVCAGVLPLAGLVQAEAVPSMELRNAQAGLAPDQPLELVWADTQMAPHWPRLSVELDGVDVTAMVERTPTGARIALPVPLSRGEHELRVVYGAPDGSLVEWGRWALRVVGEPLWRAQADAVLTLDGLVHNRGSLVRNAPRGLEAEGAAQVRVQREAEGMNVQGRADLWLNSRRDANPGGNTADIGEYLIEGDAGSWQWRLGHQQLGYDSLIHSAFLRRGISARWGLGDDASLSGFALRSEPQLGAEDFTGVSRDRHRVSGLVYERAWEQEGGRTVSLSAALVGGEGNDLQGADPSATAPLHRGQAWSLAGQAAWAHGRLRARAEVAGTRYDWNNGGQAGLGNGREHDDAHALTLDWTPAPTASGSAWTLGLDHRVVGTFFRSVAHVGLPGDRAMDRVHASWRAGAWMASGSLMRQHTNANDLADLPSIASRQADALLSWTPLLEGAMPWYGQPSLSLSVSQLRQEQRSTPAAFIGTAVDNRQWQGGLTAVFNHERWNTSIGLGSGAYTDRALPDLSTRSRTLSWGAYLQAGEHWSIGPQVEWARVREVASGQRRTERTASLFTDFALIPDRLLGNLNIGVNLARRTLDSQRETNRFAVGELIWRLQKASLNRAGWDLRLSFSKQDFEDVLDPTRSGRGDQIFLGVTMTLPVATRD
jgi:hypothetical protein